MENQNSNVAANMSNTNLDNIPKIEYNKKMLNKWVFCLLNGGFYGLVTDVLDEENFKIRTDKGEIKTVSLFDIRAV